MTPEGSVSPHMKDCSLVLCKPFLLFLHFGPTEKLRFMRSLIKYMMCIYTKCGTQLKLPNRTSPTFNILCKRRPEYTEYENTALLS